MPTARRLGVLVPITILWFAPLAQLRMCAGFSRYILRVCQVHFTRVRFVDAETTSLKEENPRGLSSSSFGRLRCRKSPARGFWMSWIHWNYYQGHLKTSFAGFFHH
jgi:hypothetical protein